ncbi:MAG: hypothetical protein U0519_04130 [Candidatus Gracilibacteria bacterium]
MIKVAEYIVVVLSFDAGGNIFAGKTTVHRGKSFKHLISIWKNAVTEITGIELLKFRIKVLDLGHKENFGELRCGFCSGFRRFIFPEGFNREVNARNQFIGKKTGMAQKHDRSRGKRQLLFSASRFGMARARSCGDIGRSSG